MIFDYIQNFLSKEDEDKIENIITCSSFPWFWFPTTAWGIDEPHQRSFFQHLAYKRDSINSDLYYVLRDTFKLPEFDTHKLVRIKANLYIKHFDRGILKPHQDLNGDDGVTYIYYPETSDGPTRFYINDGITEVDPVKGDMIRFDSKIFHTSDVPREHERRSCINFVFGDQLN